MFPNGINMLSLFSRIGEAEVALHSHALRLMIIVIVEKCEARRDMLKDWWEGNNITET
jgi:hypothetical protein